ncbi:MAG TPA: 50S ribosomal protein L3 [Synergistales bacterium]|nr:50S ribosomal protein L3 [Synergistales bacterium]HRV70984.1 50S ribosomal protein L3 [Thermovirgaceae bacterium]
MSMGILGRKLGMTQIYDEKGHSVPVTVIEAGPCTVVAVRTMEKNGYTSVSLGFGKVKAEKLPRPYRGVFEKKGLEPTRWIREFRVDDTGEYEPGKVVSVDLFQEGDTVDVTGKSKGKGFAGVIKRHHFQGGPGSHGASKFHRQPGSAGASSYPGHIFKGKTMPGRMGGERVTVKNLSIAGVDIENNLLLVKGAIPGPRNGLVMIRKQDGAAR